MGNSFLFKLNRLRSGRLCCVISSYPALLGKIVSFFHILSFLDAVSLFGNFHKELGILAVDALYNDMSVMEMNYLA